MSEPKELELDLGKIANLDALKATDKVASAFVEKAKSTKKKTGKFNFVKPEMVQLPSGGRFYETVSEDENIKNGFIELYPMTLKEEEILTTPKFIKAGSATRMIFDNCIASDIEAGDILSFDSTYLLYKLREMSYGKDYSFKIKCKSCGAEHEETVDISELTFEELPKEVEEPFTIKLPISKYTVQLILSRVIHSEKLYQKQKEMPDVNSRIISLLLTTISIRDEKGKELNPKDWQEFYEALPTNDRKELSKATKFSTGVDEIDIVCPKCGEEAREDIPLGADFFCL